MNRRKFFELAAPLSISPFFINGISTQLFNNPALLNPLTCVGINERVLVIIYMNGGNDGVNTIVPVDQYDLYMGVRPTIGLPNTGPNRYIDLDLTLGIEDQVGLHPGMTGIKSLYDQGKVNIVQAVGYPDYNKSHFKSTDLWLIGGDGTSAGVSSGWMGRYLDYTFPNAAGTPTVAMPDPLGLQLGDNKLSLGFRTEHEHSSGINLTGQDPAGFYTFISEIGGIPMANLPASDYGEELQFIINLEASVGSYAQRITDVFNNGSNAVTYPSSKLADQLKTVARLISGGSKTKVFLVNISGFDTHAEQVEDDNPSIGRHANLLSDLSNAVKAFQDDLDGLGLGNRVMTVTFSEFGRKPVENGDYGTDHGTIAPMFIFGNAVQAGMTGTNVDLANLDSGHFSGFQHDYRQVYTTILQDWLGADDNALAATQFGAYTNSKLPLVGTNMVVDPSCYVTPLAGDTIFFRVSTEDDKEVQMEWETNKAVEHFEIECSKDGRHFVSINTVSGSGVAFGTQRYTMVDEKPLSGTSYYRLKITDSQDKVHYSKPMPVRIQQQEKLKLNVYPNPASTECKLAITTERETLASINLANLSGTVLKTFTFHIKTGFNKVPLDVSDLLPGSYYVFLEAQDFRAKKAVPLLVQR